MRRFQTLLLLSFVVSVPLAAQPRVGEVVLAAGEVTSTLPDGRSGALAPGDDVLLLTRVETGRRSAAQMTFDPQGALQLGAEARVVLDRSEVDELTGRNRSTLSLLLGRLRLALVPGAETDVTVDTPTATIGVKGTDVRFEVDRRGATVVAVYEGEVTVTSKAGGEALTLEAPRLTVVEPGRLPTPPAFVRPEGGLQSPSADDPVAPWEGLTDTPAEPILENLPIPREPDGQGPIFGVRSP